jgi:murein DD-endopeptidase MepM/ murein hydrolase activator NlpD
VGHAARISVVGILWAASCGGRQDAGVHRVGVVARTTEALVATSSASPDALEPPPDVDEPASVGPRSKPLPNGLFNPMPSGVMAGYRADTGLDIAGSPRPVFAIAAGKLDYAEAGHTSWTGKRDSPFTVRIELDEPIPWKDRSITHVWYAHLSALTVEQPEGHTPRARIVAGQQLGISGTARGSPHLHLGLLLDGEVSQSWGSFLLEDDVRQVLGGWRRAARLPSE